MTPLAIIFIILVVLGFALHFLSTFPATPWAARYAWGCWLAAALIWAVGGGR